MNGPGSYRSDELEQMFGRQNRGELTVLKSEPWYEYVSQAQKFIPIQYWDTNATLATLHEIQNLAYYEVLHNKHYGHRSYWSYQCGPLASTPLEAVALVFYHQVKFSWKQEGF